MESTTKVAARPKSSKNTRNCQNQTVDYDVAGGVMDIWISSSIVILRMVQRRI